MLKKIHRHIHVPGHLSGFRARETLDKRPNTSTSHFEADPSSCHIPIHYSSLLYIFNRAYCSTFQISSLITTLDACQLIYTLVIRYAWHALLARYDITLAVLLCIIESVRVHGDWNNCTVDAQSSLSAIINLVILRSLGAAFIVGSPLFLIRLRISRSLVRLSTIVGANEYVFQRRRCMTNNYYILQWLIFILLFLRSLRPRCEQVN